MKQTSLSGEPLASEPRRDDFTVLCEELQSPNQGGQIPYILS